MSSLPWSAKGTKAIPVDADQFMLIDSEDIPGPTQNKLTTLAGILSSFTSSEILLVKEQANLEAEFGSDIIIPDGETWTIIVLESFTLSKPIKIGSNSTLELRAAAANTLITYTGTGAMFQNENSANPILSLNINNIGLSSVGVEQLFDIVGNGRFSLDVVGISAFESLGVVESMFVVITAGTGNINAGITFVEPLNVICVGFNHTRFGPPIDLVFITILSTGNPGVSIKDSFVNNTLADVVFFDPSSGVTSDYTIENVKGTFVNLFVPGVDLAVTQVDDAAGQARFRASAHGYVVGDRIVHSGFLVGSYNGTFIVNNVPTAAEYMTGAGFVSDDTGNTTQASRDSTDVVVRAINNQGSPDSMFTGDAGLEIFGSEQTVIINTIGVPEVVTNAAWAFSNLERFAIGVNNEGQINTEDTELRRYSIGYFGTLEKVGGGSVNVGIVLLKNGSLAGFNAPHTVNTGKIQISGSDIIELTVNDTLQVGVINYADTSSIDVSQIGLVVNLA